MYSLRVFSLLLFLLALVPTGQAKEGNPGPQITTIEHGFAYQTGEVFFNAPQAFLISDDSGSKIRCPKLFLRNPIRIALEDVLIFPCGRGVCFDGKNSVVGRVRGTLVRKGDWFKGEVELVGLSNPPVKIIFESGGEALRGEIVWGKVKGIWAWMNELKALYFGLASAPFNYLSYQVWGKVLGSGSLTGGILVFQKGEGEVTGYFYLSGGWVSRELLANLKSNGVPSGASTLPVEKGLLKVVGTFSGLRVRVAIRSTVGRFDSQFFAPLKILAILKGSKEVGR